jgi:hypothetical protein
MCSFSELKTNAALSELAKQGLVMKMPGRSDRWRVTDNAQKEATNTDDPTTFTADENWFIASGAPSPLVKASLSASPSLTTEKHRSRKHEEILTGRESSTEEMSSQHTEITSQAASKCSIVDKPIYQNKRSKFEVKRSRR